MITRWTALFFLGTLINAVPASAQDGSICPGTFLPYALRSGVLCHDAALSPSMPTPPDPSERWPRSVRWNIHSDNFLATVLPSGITFISIADRAWPDERFEAATYPGPYENSYLHRDSAGRDSLHSDALELFGNPVGLRCFTIEDRAPEAVRCFIRARLGETFRVYIHVRDTDGSWPVLNADFADTWPDALHAIEAGFAQAFTLPEG